MFKTVKNNMSLVSEAHPDYEKLATPEVRAAVERASKFANTSAEESAKSLGATMDIRAKYKIELTFGKERTLNGPNVCGVKLWESGKKMHGGGDAMMYWCLDTESDAGCGAPITEDAITGPYAFCSSCQKGLLIERATDMLIFKLRTDKLAARIAQIFRTLNSNADIYVKYHQQDVHYIAMLKAKGHKAANRLKGMHIYPLKNILKETANGTDLTNRIYAFLTA